MEQETGLKAIPFSDNLAKILDAAIRLLRIALSKLSETHYQNVVLQLFMNFGKRFQVN